jgi:hypothetical protein
MLSQTLITTRGAASLGMREKLVIGGQSCAVGRRVPQVPADGPTPNIYPPQAKVHQAQG